MINKDLTVVKKIMVTIQHDDMCGSDCESCFHAVSFSLSVVQICGSNEYRTRRTRKTMTIFVFEHGKV